VQSSILSPWLAEKDSPSEEEDEEYYRVSFLVADMAAYYLFCSKHISSSAGVGSCLVVVTCKRGICDLELEFVLPAEKVGKSGPLLRRAAVARASSSKY
jgi:hypothetical protein